MPAEKSQSPGRSPRLRWLAIAIIVAVTLLRLAYLFYFCPYDLAPDEAHYWDWSRHLDWSYYSKGPLVAWTIRGGCELFGSAALTLNGTLMPAVRVPAVLFGTGLLAALYILTWQTFRSDRLALAIVLGALTLPPIAASSLIMTIDSPFLCLWAWALVFGRSAMIDGKKWAWPAAGVFIALGILAKYTMGLWLLSAGMFLLFTPSHRALLFRCGFWSMAFTAALSAIPILLWNAQHDWVSFRHVAVQTGVVESKKSAGLRWLGPFEFALGQLALLLGFWFIAWVLAMIRFRPVGQCPPSIRYLWWMSVPTFAVCAASSLRAAGQLNWAAAGYISGAVLVVGWLADVARAERSRWQQVTRWCARATLALGAIITLAAHDSRQVTRLIAPALREESRADPAPLRHYDLAARLKGSRHLAAEIDQLRQIIRDRDGAEPILVGLRWDQPGLLGFYCAGQPQAYSIGRILGIDRHSQYDFWRPSPTDDAQAFLGKTFLIVGAGDPRLLLGSSFESIELAREVVYREHGRAVGWWVVTVCRGFRGIDPSLYPAGSNEH